MPKQLQLNSFTRKAVWLFLSINALFDYATSLNIPSPLHNLITPSNNVHITLQMSSDDGFGSDDLAKLRNKRKEILAKKQAPSSPATPPESIIPDTTTEGADISSLPKLERPDIMKSRVAAKEAAAAAMSAKEEAKKNVDNASNKPTPVAGLGIDYMADYEDENELHIPNRIGFATDSWGDESKGFVPKTKKKLKKKQITAGKFLPGDLQVAYNTLVSGGIRFVDTSEAFGTTLHSKGLSAETLVGQFTEEYTLTTDTPLIGTTFANPYTLFAASKGNSGIRLGSGGVLGALEKSCQRLETSNIELYQIENVGLLGGYVGGKGALASGLALTIERGYCNHVGVKNVGARSLKGFQKMMEKRGASVSTNQFEFSLTNRKALKNGTIQACKNLGITPIAYNPLGDGLASGQFTANNPTGGQVGGEMKFSFKKVLEPLIPLHDAQIRVATKVKERLKQEFRDEQNRRSRKYQNPMEGNGNRDITPLQVAINYVVAKGAVPVPIIKNNQEAEELLGCLGWELNAEEVGILDSAADLCRR